MLGNWDYISLLNEFDSTVDGDWHRNRYRLFYSNLTYPSDFDCILTRIIYQQRREHDYRTLFCSGSRALEYLQTCITLNCIGELYFTSQGSA